MPDVTGEVRVARKTLEGFHLRFELVFVRVVIDIEFLDGNNESSDPIDTNVNTTKPTGPVSA